MRHPAGWFGVVGSIAAAAGATGVLVLALAIGLVGCGSGPSTQVADASHSSVFAVLRTPRTSGDVVPLFVARFLLEGNEPKLAETDLQDARRVLPDQQGWLVPAPEDKLCLVRVVYPLISKSHGEDLPPSVNRTCSTQGAVEAGRLMETQSLSTTLAKRLPTRVDGVVPDGVHHVVVRSIGDTKKAVPVVRNAYEVIVVNPRTVSFVAEQAGRRRRYVVQTPSAAGGRPYPLPGHRR
jgi:hypothetical protein